MAQKCCSTFPFQSCVDDILHYIRLTAPINFLTADWLIQFWVIAGMLLLVRALWGNSPFSSTRDTVQCARQHVLQMGTTCTKNAWSHEAQTQS